MMLLAGAVIVFAAAFLGGVTGFGYSLVATPLLLLAGYSLAFVVTVNLALAFLTRIPVAYRFREDLDRRRVAALVGGSVPGLALGVVVLSALDEAIIKVAAGLIVMIAAILLARSVTAPPPKRIRGATGVAGFLGGFMGAATSLNGVAPVLLLARDKASQTSFLADLALYFVAANGIGLILLAAGGALEADAFWPAFALWLPGSLLGNWLGTTLGPRLPERAFRRLTLALVFVAGAVTVATA